MSNRDTLFYALKEVDGSLVVLHLMISELSRQTGKTEEISEALDTITRAVEEMKKEVSLDPNTPDDGRANLYVGIDKSVQLLKNSIGESKESTVNAQVKASP